MKKINILIIITMFANLNAQKLPLDLKTLYELSEIKAFSFDSILPRGINGSFSYYNKNTTQKAFLENFEFAFPFVGKSALIKKNGKFGIIDLKGNYVIKPVHNNYKYCYGEKHLVQFSENFVFNLYECKRTNENKRRMGCTDEYFHHFKPFSKNNKFGMKIYRDNKIETITDAKYDSIITDIFSDFLVVKSNNKIGIIDINAKNITKIIYDDIIFNRGDVKRIKRIGLKNKSQWVYFDLPKKILTSRYKCIQLEGLIIKNAFGKFKKGNQFNILFKNGETFKTYFDWISDNGLVGVKNKYVYFLKPDGNHILYYK